ncbi:septation protein A [Xenorhabdus innexi]|uniref:Inner membrane-spanning protein YciB n=1 Tax=Xenorhabdus innexi TaxID=290109 RepID=A0A1N6MYI3_9GAMM|nr:septation protein A [Xenorhabdus innexi]PHM38772.1 intracellular septation protein A [Xenorhabdus innexi]SIP73789.1 putative intracellular septation protein [Xenorhabdus innexi]
MKQLLDFLPLVVFFVVYKMYDIFYASGALIAATGLAVVITYAVYRKVEKSSLITFAITAVFGTLTLALHDPLFMKWKVTAVYAIFALALLISQWVMKKPLIQRMLGKELELPVAIWNKLNMAWAIFFIACALANIYVAFWLPLDVWVNFKVFGLMALTLVFIVLSVIYIYRHLPREQE